jgi:hypothetical protein
MVKNIIFLDIDGVLTFGNNFILNESKFRMIADMCEQYNIRIVLSSSWREFNYNDTIQSLQKNKLFNIIIPYIVGITPRVYRLSRTGEIELFIDYVKSNVTSSIFDKLYFKHKDNEILDIKFLIIDDEDIDHYYKDYHIQTNMFVGLEQEHINQIIKYFDNNE